jgi:SAM-dependent methyltransferase
VSGEATTSDERAEALQRELEERTARANDAIAAAQDRTYWLDRWRLDPDALMKTGAGRGAYAVARGAWRAARALRRHGGRAFYELRSVPADVRAESAEEIDHQGLPRARFARTARPAPLLASPVSDVLFERLDDGDVRAIEASLAEADRALWETADDADRKRLALSFGVHHEVPGVLERTGLTTAMPPGEVHSMARGAAAAGGSPYYADLVTDALRRAGLDPADAGAGLDFGCSSGRVVRVLNAAFGEVDWYGCDPIAPAVEWAQANLPGIDFRVSPEHPPLPYDDGAFGLVFAISIWSHFNAPAAVAWLGEMRRIVRPGGMLLVTTHGFQTLAHDEEGGLRGPDQLAGIERALFEEGFWFRDEFGETGDHGITDADWGTAFMTPEWLLSRVTPDWRLALFAPGRVEDNQDLYVLERR